MSSADGWLAANRDLVAAGTLALVAFVTSGISETGTVWFLLALLLLVVLPGYVTVAFAYAGSAGGPGSSGLAGWTLVSLSERIGLSLGGSMAILPILAILTKFSPLGLTPAGLVTVVSGYVLVAAVAAADRRRRHAETPGWKTQSGAESSTGTWTATVQAVRRMRLLDGLLAVSIVFAVVTLGVAVAVPSQGAGATDLHLLTQQDGRLVADDYPNTLTEGESAPLVVGVTNGENEFAEFTIVAELQRVQTEGSSVIVLDKQTVGRYSMELEDGETSRRQLEVRGSMTGENLRFAVYLYRGEAPGVPTVDTAYRTTYIWLDVEPSGTD